MTRIFLCPLLLLALPTLADAAQPRKPNIVFLRTDVGEKKNVAAGHPDEVRRVEEYLRHARSESAHWPIKAGKK